MAIYHYFGIPFGLDGDIAPIPDSSQPDGSVSFDRGYGPDYSLDPDAVGVLYPERDKMNWLFYAITDALRMFQLEGFPDWDASINYKKNSWVRYSDDNVYFSLVADNLGNLPTDPTKWTMFSQVAAVSFITGDTIIWESSVLRTGGWVWANGTTVGSGASGATGRANADTQDLFTLIWSSFPNTQRTIQNSDGSPGTRGVSAAADFAANKRIPVADMRGRVPAGADNMGGSTAAGRLTNTPTGGADGSQIGNAGGAQGVALTSTQNATHNHSASGIGISVTGTPTAQIPLYDTSDPDIPPGRKIVVGFGDVVYPVHNTYSASLSGSFSFAVTGSTGNSGSGASHNNVQPTYVCNWVTKL